MTPATLEKPNDVIDDSIQIARGAMRSIGRGIQQFDELKGEAASRVKRQPLRAIGIAAACGLMIGVAVGWMGERYRHAHTH